MLRRHPNYAKMQKAVAGWIADARHYAFPAKLLRARAEWVERQLQELGNPCTAIPKHLKGLTAFDLTIAAGDLHIAASEWERIAAERAAAQTQAAA